MERRRKEREQGGEKPPTNQPTNQDGLVETSWSYLVAAFTKASADLHNDPGQFFPIKKNIATNKPSLSILITDHGYNCCIFKTLFIN